jgi:hypothetical protein
MIELQTSVKQDDTTRTRTPKPGYLNLSNNAGKFEGEDGLGSPASAPNLPTRVTVGNAS